MKILKKIQSFPFNLTTDRIARGIIYALLFALPLTFSRTSAGAVSFHQESLIIGGGLLLAAVWGVHVYRRGDLRYRPHPVDWLLLVFVIVYFVASLLGASIEQSLTGPGYSGALIASLGIVYFAVRYFFQSREHVHAAGRSAIAGCILLILMYLLDSLIPQTGIFVAGLSMLATALWFTAVVCGIWYFVGERRAVKIAASLVWLGSFVYLVFIDHTAGLLASLLSVFVLLALLQKQDRYIRQWTYLVFVIIITAHALALVFPVSTWLGLPVSVVLRPSFGVDWEIMRGVLAASPLFGVGPGLYDIAYNAFRPIDLNQTFLWDVTFYTGASFFTHLAITGGIFSLVALFASFVKTAYHGIRLAASQTVTNLAGLKRTVEFGGMVAIFVALIAISIIAPADPLALLLLFLLGAVIASYVSDIQYIVKLGAVARYSLVTAACLLATVAFFFIGQARYGWGSVQNTTVIDRAATIENRLQDLSNAQENRAQEQQIAAEIAQLVATGSPRYEVSKELLLLSMIANGVFNEAWQDTEGISQKLIDQSPHSAEAYFLAGNADVVILENSINGRIDPNALGIDPNAVITRAVDRLNQSIEYKPDFALAYQRLGDLFLMLEDAKSAESSYTKALLLDFNRDTLFNLVQVLERQEEKETAIGLIDLYLKQAPDDEEVRAYRDRLAQ